MERWARRLTICTNHGGTTRNSHDTMNQNLPAGIEGVLDEGACDGQMDQQILKLGVLYWYTEVAFVLGSGWVFWTHRKDVCYSQPRPLRGRQRDLQTTAHEGSSGSGGRGAANTPSDVESAVDNGVDVV